ncbi:c-type cytochrome biogenesis protein CcmI [Shewanella sp. VB17]|uniref:c-type cytochrome biogenesis protein CcmI n=1 Tax=Shewanella sp. VB17 TaxID=2739432 RepID=UPI001567B725|nr:c-type cytochrome biogenesis protein CcmI [Shewanella sp. VB17]NRD72129.1 c-type cytochrome biogenesis protein CcmI [Shewanella sp. VB17]
MTTLWIFIALFLLVSLVLIWFPHFRQQQMLQTEEADFRKKTNLELFQNRLATLEKERTDEQIDQIEFNALKKELEISLLQDTQQCADESLVIKITPKGLLWPGVMSLAILSISGYFYINLGAYANVNQAEQVSIHPSMTAEQIMQQRLKMMEAQIELEPENSQLLFSLGHRYISANRYDDAIKTFNKAIELVGSHAELLGPKATAMYYKANQQMTPEIQAIIDTSLSLDPEDPSTLLLVGMNSYFTNNYQKSIDAWQIILDSKREDVDRSAIINAIDTAKMRIKAKTGVMPNDKINTVKSVTVEVSISPELQNKVDENDTLFIFARNTEGQKLPLAATKISAKSLPATITLDNSTSMSDAIKLSDVSNVEIIAVLSKHGSVKPQPGDIRGRLKTMPVGSNAKLVLDTQVQ